MFVITCPCPCPIVPHAYLTVRPSSDYPTFLGMAHGSILLEFDMSVGVLAKRRFSLIGLGFGLGFEANIRLGEFDF